MNKVKKRAFSIRVQKDGPYLVLGPLPLSTETIGTNGKGESVRWEKGPAITTGEEYALCRCGRSGSKPFCDGSHGSGFDGTETALRQPYLEQAVLLEGPVLSLTDAESLCAFARFCDPHGRVWNLVHQTDREVARRHFVRETGDCPAGRLVAWDNATGTPVEPEHLPSIALVEDPSRQCSGPIWVRGGVPVISADGVTYEVRNRVTLCRCGESHNKPFCDGTHAEIGFDGRS